MHCTEFTVPSQGSYDPATHLSLNDIAVDDLSNPTVVVISIKQSKTDPLRKGAFRSYLKALLNQLGLDNSCYNTHSFRIGAATSAESAGLSESQIKTMGRWRSDAYRRYIKPTHSAIRYLHLSTNHLTAYSTQLTPRVQQVLRGIKRHQAHEFTPSQRLPITTNIMH